MSSIFKTAIFLPALLVASYGQTPGKTEFDVASIKTNEAQGGFHFAADSASGGPGTADPGTFRCSRCSLATLIVKAFNLQPYQFPGRTALTDHTYEVMAKVPEGATQAEFSAMLQNLLKARFGLTSHFEEKKMKGYHLTVAKNGPKLTESAAVSSPSAADSHRAGQGESHSHSGAMVFGTSATYRAGNQSMADLVRVLSDQIGLPVDDQTGLSGKYDLALRWSGTGAPHDNHADGAYSGGGHAGHDGGDGATAGAAGDPGGLTLFDALQQQLGLRLAPAEQAIARLFVVDRVAKTPTEN